MPRRLDSRTAAQLKARASSTRSARRRRERDLAELNRGAAHCQRRLSATTVCGGRLEDAIDRTGRVHTACPRCARRAAGICQDCPRPVLGTVGHALRCADCKRRRNRETSRNYAVRNAERLRERWQEGWRALPEEVRRAKLAAKRIWRRANPDKVREYRHRERETRAAQIKAYHKKRRDARRAEINEKARAYYYATAPRPSIAPCVGCGAAIRWAPPGRPKKRCDDCVPPSVRARRRPAVPDYERPAIAAPARTCITRGCRTVVNGRAKKCFACKQKQMATARLLLGSRRAT